MQKNWHIVYTRPKCELKVSSLLTKNKIENFCPVNRTEVTYLRRSRKLYEPLFQNFVFVNIVKDNVFKLPKFQNVIGLVYWKQAPAIVKDEEIEAIREFMDTYKNIKIEKTEVDVDDVVRNLDSSFYSFDRKFLAVKSEKVKVNLPSLGVVMVAETEGDKIFKRGVTMFQNPSYSN